MKKRTKWGVATLSKLSACGFILLLASVGSTQPIVNDPNLEAVPVVSGFNQCVNMAFMGPNDFFVVEKASGRVHRIVNGVNMGVVLDLAVNSASERGLLSIELHPNFSQNSYVYMYWSESSTGADTNVVADIPLMGNRVDRFIWNGTSLTFDRSILPIRAYQADAGQPIRGNHDGGVVRFGPDGKLYIIVGDLGRRGWLQNNLQGPVPDDQFGGPEPDAAHTSGVIFRLNDDGSAPSDNPFFGQLPNTRVNMLYGYGVRNGFGLAFDPQTGKLWTQENGDDTFDEINLVGSGFNGGWIQFMGPHYRIHEFRDIEVARGNSLQQLRWPPTNIATNYITGYKRLFKLKGSVYTDPKFSWKFANAPAALGFINTSSLGKAYTGQMLIGASRTTLQGGYLYMLKMNAQRDGFVIDDPRLNDLVADNLDKFERTECESIELGTNFGVVTDIQTTPDGKVYLCSLDQGTIFELKRR